MSTAGGIDVKLLLKSLESIYLEVAMNWMLASQCPPLVVVKLEEQPTPMHAPEFVRSDADFPSPKSRSDHTLVSSSWTCSLMSSFQTNSSGSAHSPIKGAYIHEYKVSEDVF